MIPLSSKVFPIFFGEEIGGAWRAAEGPSPLLISTNKKDTRKLFDVHTCLFCIILYYAFCSSHSTRLIVNRDEEQRISA